MKETQLVDAVILAGTHKNPKRLVLGQNKSFLPLRGKPIIQYVIEALAQSPMIDRIAVVGPQEYIERELTGCKAKFIAVPERGSFLLNAWIGYQALLEDRSGFSDSGKVRELLGRDLPQFRPFTPLGVKFQLIATIAYAMQLERREALPIYRVEKMVDEYFITKRRHGYQISGKRQEDMIRSLAGDQRLFVIANDEVKFREPLIAGYFQALGEWIEKPVLYSSGDIPFIIPEAVTDFIERCHPLDHDFYFGMNERRDLQPYVGDELTPGLNRPYMEFHEFCARAANLSLLRPKKIGNVNLVQQSFNVRKLKEWRNVLRLMKILYRVPGGFKSIRYVGLFQLAKVLSNHRHEWLSRQIRRLLPIFKIEAAATRLLQTDFRIILSPFGGLSVDIDTDEDYKIIQERFDEWLDLQYRTYKKLGVQKAAESPSSISLG